MRKGFYSQNILQQGFCPQNILQQGICPKDILQNTQNTQKMFIGARFSSQKMLQLIKYYS